MKAALVIAGLLALMTAGCGRPHADFDSRWMPRGEYKFIVPVQHIAAPVKTRDC